MNHNVGTEISWSGLLCAEGCAGHVGSTRKTRDGLKFVFDFGGDQHQVLDACPDAGDDGVSVGFGDAVTGEDGGSLGSDAHDLGAGIERLLGASLWGGGSSGGQANGSQAAIKQQAIKQGVVTGGVVERDQVLSGQVVPLTRRIEFVVKHMARHADAFRQMADVVRLFEQVAGPGKVAV